MGEKKPRMMITVVETVETALCILSFYAVYGRK